MLPSSATAWASRFPTRSQRQYLRAWVARSSIALERCAVTDDKGAFEAFCLQVVYDKPSRRIEISVTITEAISEALENAKDLPQEVSSVAQRDIAGARFVPPSDARVLQRYRLVA